MSFHNFNFHPSILTNINALGFKTPTPIQSKSIPPILKGQDLMGLAQTGTGKTAAFVLPLLQQLTASKAPSRHPRALIIAPTRELTQQIQEAIHTLGRGLGIHSAAIYGGVSIRPQIEKLRRGVDIIVACPGRLLDHVRQGTIQLSQAEMLILDEADQLFDMGFLPNIRQILQKLPKKRQSLLFSATMPKEIRQLANEMLDRPVTVQIANNAPAASVTQTLFPITQPLKTDLVIKILQTTPVKSMLIFARTKQRATHLAEQLSYVGYAAASIQGNLSQSKRQKALDDFRRGKLKILVATDVASRGIHVEEISHVINFDMPDTAEAYTHRIGRTGRASKLGEAYSFILKEDAGKVRAVEKILGISLERRVLTDFDYNAKSSLPLAPKEREPKAPFAHRGKKPAFTKKEKSEFTKKAKPRFPKREKPAEADGKKRFRKFSGSKKTKS